MLLSNEFLFTKDLDPISVPQFFKLQEKRSTRIFHLRGQYVTIEKKDLQLYIKVKEKDVYTYLC